MTCQGSIDRDLETLAHSAAELLNVPFVTIMLSTENGARGYFIDASWAAEHPEINVAGLNNPNSAVAQDMPFFAAVPIRSNGGANMGSLSCGGSEVRDLSDHELHMLKDIAAQVATRIDVLKAAPAFAQG